MSTQNILKANWKSYLDDYSKHILSEVVELDVESLELGDQIEAEWTRLKGLSYDPKNDTLYIFTDAIRHFIAHPKNIWIVEDAGKISTIQIEDAAEVKHLINVRSAASIKAHADRDLKHGQGASV